MPQLSLYLTQNNYNIILNEAKLANMSLSKWATKKMLSGFKPSFPAGYEKLCGCFSDDELKRPAQLDWTSDAKREEI